jgi:hypothetical protein
MPRMDSHRLAGLQVVGHDFSIQLNPGMTTTTQALKQGSIPSKDTGYKRLLEANAKIYPVPGSIKRRQARSRSKRLTAGRNYLGP